MRMVHNDTPVVTDNSQCNGVLMVVIASPVVCNTTTVGDSTVDLNMWIACGENYIFEFPRSSLAKAGSNVYYRYPLSNQPAAVPGGTYTLIAFAGNEDEDTSIDSRFAKEFPPLIPAKHHVVKKITSGEEIQSIKQLTNRYVRQKSITLTTAFQEFALDNLSLKVGTDEPFNIFSAWAMYAKGSMRWKLISEYTSASFVNSSILAYLTKTSNGTPRTYDSYASYTSNGAFYQSLFNGQAVDITVPYFHRLPYLHSQSLFVTGEREEVTAAFQYLPFAPGTRTFGLWRASGEDYSFGCL